MFDFRYLNLTGFTVSSPTLGIQYEAGVSPVISAVTAVTIFILGVKIIRVLFTEDNELIRDSSKTHSWKNTATFQGSNYCNVCETLIMSGGVYCDCCGLYSDLSCTTIANKSEPCKAVTLNPEKLMKHHWIRGNLPPSSMCDVCDSSCFGTALDNFRCCWCLRTIHTACKPNIAELCDFGPYKSLIIPPSSIEVVTRRSSIKKLLVLKSVRPTNWTDWSPLIVIINCKSGNSDGGDILSAFRGILHPAQVIDLRKQKPEAALEWCVQLGHIQCKILVAGGDGTVGWVLNSIAKAKLKAIPAVGILPLGTGNDLSRVLGWGKGVSSHVEPTSVLDSVMEASTVPLDRWKVIITPKRTLRIHSANKEVFMYNYLSIGVDAQVTLDFHKARESPFYLFSNRVFNKLLYLGYGTQQLIEKKCQGLNKKIELYLDGEKKKLPEIESIVVLNIDSWGAGVQLWKMSETEENKTIQSYNDGRLEVVALYSSLHIAQLQMGLGVPFRVGQANHVEIRLKSPIAVQVDGEPWMQQPAVFTISHFNEALMLKNK